MSVKVIYKDDNHDRLYLSNGMVLVASSYLQYGKEVLAAKLIERMGEQGRYDIIGANSGQAVGIYDLNAGYPTYYDNGGGGNANMGGIMSQANGMMGGGLSSPVSDMGHIGDTPSTSYDQQMNISEPIVSHTPAPQKSDSSQTDNRVPMEGHSGKPIPTKYNDVKLVLDGNSYRWTLVDSKDISQGINNMDKINNHNKVYQSLLDSSKKESNVLTVNYIPDIVSDSDMCHIYVSSLCPMDSAVATTLEKSYGVYKSIRADREGDVYNALTGLASDCISTDTHPIVMWTDTVLGMTKPFARRAINNLLADLFTDFISGIDGCIKITKDTDILTDMVDLVKYSYSIKDMSIRGRYIAALDSMYDVVTSDEYIRRYTTEVKDATDVSMDVLGLRRQYAYFTTNPNRSSNLWTEIEEMIRVGNDLDNGSYIIKDNTPNLLKLVTAIFTGNIRTDSGKSLSVIDLGDSANVIILQISEYRLKIVNDRHYSVTIID